MARSSGLPALLFVLVVFGVIGAGGYLLFQDTTPPQITLSPQVERVSPGQKFTVSAVDAKSPVQYISVAVRRGMQVQVLGKETFTDKALQQKLSFALTDTGLRDGLFTLEVTAADASFAGFGRGNTETKIFSMRMDTTPPKLALKTQPPYVRRGGTGCVVYTVTKETERTGVKVGDLFFPGFKQPGGEFVCFFAFPYFMTVQQFQPELSATDLAGNTTSIRLPVYRINQNFQQDTVTVSERLLQDKMPYFESMLPGASSPIDLFNKVNGELRKSNAETLMQIGKKTGPVMLWQDFFVPLPNGATRARFADHRTYVYNGQKQPVQATHLGLDLASLAQSPVPAANAGNVVFAGELGIYGNMVVIDHGLGLQSLYSHLTDYQVSAGQKVNRGDIIGHTGTTGMAVGDHLHFGILVSGLEVSPIEWLDGHWIRDNIVDRLTAAGIQAPSLSTLPAPPAEPARAQPAKSADGKAKKPADKKKRR